MFHSKSIKWVFFGVLIVYLASFIYYEKWDTGIIGGGDSWGYNAYLPAVFIHRDLDNLKTTYYYNRLTIHST